MSFQRGSRSRGSGTWPARHLSALCAMTRFSFPHEEPDSSCRGQCDRSPVDLCCRTWRKPCRQATLPVELPTNAAGIRAALPWSRRAYADNTLNCCAPDEDRTRLNGSTIRLPHQMHTGAESVPARIRTGSLTLRRGAWYPVPPRGLAVRPGGFEPTKGLA